MRITALLALTASLATAQFKSGDPELKGVSKGPISSTPGGVKQGAQQGSQPGRGRLPNGFTQAARSGNIGQALTAGFAAGPSAKAAFRLTLRQVSGYFDRPLTLLSAAGDAADAQVQATFRSSFGNANVQGVVLVTASNGKASALLMFDREDLARQSLPAMSRQVAASAPKAPGGGGAPQRPQLVRTPLLDNSGFIGVPAGWRITGSYKGTVDVTGPNGEGVSLGGYQQVFPRGNYPNKINGPYLQPWPAMMAFEDSILDHVLSKRQGSIRLIEQAPAQAPAGQQSAYLSFEVQAQNKKYRALAAVITAPLHDDLGSWFFYDSIVAAPSDRFPQSFPTMWEMWKSWSVNQEVFRERMDSALKSMRETFQIYQAANAYRQHVYDNTNYAWDETIRGVTMIEDTTTHERAEFDTNYAQYLIDEANRQGYQWQVVPLGQLVP